MTVIRIIQTDLLIVEQLILMNIKRTTNTKFSVCVKMFLKACFHVHCVRFNAKADGTKSLLFKSNMKNSYQYNLKYFREETQCLK